MKRFALFLTIICIAPRSRAQQAEDSVKRVVNNLFTAMRNSDTILLRSVFTEQALLQTLSNSDGQTKVTTEPIEAFIKAIGRPHAEIYDERIRFESVLVDGDLASVWTPYTFYIGNRFSHCGVNSFQLVRLKEGWKIQYLVDTRRKTPCE